MTITTTSIGQRIAELPWPELHEALDAHGFARTGPVLAEEECRELAASYDTATFRSTIDMARYRFGEGEYKYFAYPLPAAVDELRHALYPQLAPERDMSRYTLIGADGRPYRSERAGTLGGHRRNRVYGRLDCPGALRWITKGHYVAHRVFFADETTAIAAGYRPCAVCLPSEYQQRITMRFTVCDTPIGPLLLAGDDHFLTRVEFHDGSSPPQAWRRDDARFAEECHQLQEYFAGTRTSFALPLRLEGSPFERRVWEALRAIPHGTITTYGKLAATLGHATAARAVGAANGRNPVAVIVPCHRVIGADGTLTGYAGGLERKRALLAHEAASARAGYAA